MTCTYYTNSTHHSRTEIIKPQTTPCVFDPCPTCCYWGWLKAITVFTKREAAVFPTARTAAVSFWSHYLQSTIVNTLHHVQLRSYRIHIHSSLRLPTLLDKTRQRQTHNDLQVHKRQWQDKRWGGESIHIPRVGSHETWIRLNTGRMVVSLSNLSHVSQNNTIVNTY